LIEIYRPTVIALQETKLGKQTPFTIPNYCCYKKEGHFNRTHHGGVGILIHQDTPHQHINLNTDIQAIAVRAKLDQLVTICSVYSSRSHELNADSMNDLVQQLPNPKIILGDFNSYNTLWGSEATDRRGRVMETIVDQNGLNIMNDGQFTRVAHGAETAIDLSLCSPQLSLTYDWTVLRSPFDSDHCPILITSTNDPTPQTSNIKSFNYRKADWESYTAHQSWSSLDDLNEPQLSNDQILDALYDVILQVANETIPQYVPSKFFPKPWWSKEVQILRNKREYLYQKYLKTKSLANLIKWKQSRAIFKQESKKSKEAAWKKTISDLRANTTITQIYETVRKIKGKKEKHINILTDNGRVYSSHSEIADKLGETLAGISSPENYCEEFQQLRELQEQVELNLDSDSNEVYNREFSFRELESALSNTKNTSPGPDSICIMMIKKLPHNARQFLLRMINRFYRESFFPDRWRRSIVVPIPKPGKNHSDPSNYRPIALTSVICKTYERMVNNRLVDYLEMNRKISYIQCGARKGRSTVDHLIRLETTIRNSFAHGEHVLSVFFDLEKAYDTTWKYGILRDLQKMGLRGPLPRFVREFLTDRTFQIRVGNTLSRPYQQQMGVPQGSVISVTLFMIKVNQIADMVPQDERFLSSLFVDDLQISFSHPDINVAGGKLQACLNNVSRWARNNGFKFSPTKTCIMMFSKNPSIIIKPDLYLNDVRLPYESNAKFLGMTWDAKLSWHQHLNKLKHDCQKPLGLLRSLTALRWGADQQSSLLIYKSLIRSKLDYASIVYNSASKTDKAIIEPVVNNALRIVSGVFKSTPTEYLNILTNEPPLQLRRDRLTLAYYFKMRGALGNPAHKLATSTRYDMLYRNKGITPSFPLRANRLINDLSIARRAIKPNFSYSILNIQTPTWTIEPPNIDMSMARLPKDTTHPSSYRQLFSSILQERYTEFTHMYTDGSKTATGVGAAFICGEVARTAALPPEATIASAELHAIQMAISFTKEKAKNKVVIFTDSMSCLETLAQINYVHPIARRIQHDVHDMMRFGSNITLCWIPSHVGINGNELVDNKAKQASVKQPQHIALFYRDLTHIARQKLYEKWKLGWQTCGRKMVELIPEPDNPPYNTGMTRGEEVILNRLRTGHTWLTHHELMSGAVAPGASPCPACGGAAFTVIHILLECPALAEERRTHLTNARTGTTHTLKELLTNGDYYRDLFTFLTNVGAYDAI